LRRHSLDRRRNDSHHLLVEVGDHSLGEEPDDRLGEDCEAARFELDKMVDPGPPGIRRGRTALEFTGLQPGQPGERFVQVGEYTRTVGALR
jgi:hypothetical protein